MVTFVEAVRAKYEHKEGSQEGGELVGGDKTGAKQVCRSEYNLVEHGWCHLGGGLFFGLFFHAT